MKFKVNYFIELLGREATDEKVKEMLSQLKQMPPVLKKGEEDAWVKYENEAFELAFEDESLINNDEYADVGDGELIFMTVYFNEFDNVILPFDIDSNDDAEAVIRKIGREADDTTEFLHDKSWVFITDKGLYYILFFEFYDDSYDEIARAGVVYSYGQLAWVNGEGKIKEE